MSSKRLSFHSAEVEVRGSELSGGLRSGSGRRSSHRWCADKQRARRRDASGERLKERRGEKMVGYSSCLSLRFTFLLSLSVTASYSVASRPTLSRKSSPAAPPKTPKATPSDLLSLLGPSDRSPPVNPLVAGELASCFRFLVPSSPAASDCGHHNKDCFIRQKLSGVGISSRREEDQLVWWPPEPVLELARLAFDSGGDPDAVHRTLDPSIVPVSQ